MPNLPDELSTAKAWHLNQFGNLHLGVAKLPNLTESNALFDIGVASDSSLCKHGAIIKLIIFSHNLVIFTQLPHVKR